MAAKDLVYLVLGIKFRIVRNRERSRYTRQSLGELELACPDIARLLHLRHKSSVPAVNQCPQLVVDIHG